ncbi:MAG: hypothetical protein KDA96_16510, partial [Planctomycetaceae bacterium]|nr:hypothetical protein [Planctomycetaceae bacterium]
MKSICTLALLAIAVTCSGMVAMSTQDDHVDIRKRAQQLNRDNNVADALTLYRQLVLDPGNSGRELPQDFQQAVMGLQQTNQLSELDVFLEEALEKHPGHWRLYEQIGKSLTQEIPSYGFLIGGQFQRGPHRGGGKMASAADRDRVRALQLVLEATRLVNADPDATGAQKAAVYRTLANLIGQPRFGEAWKLQELTDLSTLPDYEEGGNPYGRGFSGGFGRGRRSPASGAPVDQNGQPVLFHLPESWEAAQSDGQRWRWALEQVSLHHPALQSEMELDWARFLQDQFGVSGSGAPIVRTGLAASRQSASETAQDKVSLNDANMLRTLPDAETVATLADGTRRITLPDEFNHIVILKRIIARDDSQRRTALDALVAERTNRHQYEQVAELLNDAIQHSRDRDDRRNLRDQIRQIRGSWLRFETSRTMPVGLNSELDLRYRNGTLVEFDARPVLIDRLLQDVKDYLQQKPAQLDHQQLEISNIGYRLIEEGGDKYLGRTAATWQTELTPPEHHFDGFTTVTVPLNKAGAWWVTAKMQDGNQSHIVLWLADTAISRKRVQEGTLYFVADAVSGSPVANANLEFFGWQQSRIERTRNYQVKTSRFAERTDKDGISVPDTTQLLRDHRWLVIARTDDGRLAYDGFNGVWSPQMLSEAEYRPIKLYSVTDRPVYRPEHTLKYRLWLRQPTYSDKENSFANQDFLVEIRNPRHEVVAERKVRSDQWGGVDGEWQIPADAMLGNWTIQLAEPNVKQPNQRASFGAATFVVEEYRKPEFAVSISTPDKPVKLGEQLEAVVQADYYFGAPVAEGTVHYK